MNSKYTCHIFMSHLYHSAYAFLKQQDLIPMPPFVLYVTLTLIFKMIIKSLNLSAVVLIKNTL